MNNAPPTEDIQAGVVALVGKGKRVLVLGTVGDELTPRLQDNGCQVVGVTADLDSLADDGAVGNEPWDAIVALRCLEHLKDPLAVLTRLRGWLKEDGSLIAGVPNIAHGSLRLALLSGHFPLSEAGWQADAPLRFFTRASLERLLEAAGFVVGRLERLTRPFDLDDAPGPPDLVPPGCLETLRQDPEAMTDQFIVVAYPLPRAGLARVQEQMRALTQARETAELRLQALEAQLAAAQAQVQALEADRSALQRENLALREQHAALEADADALREALAEQSADLASLSRQVAAAPQREVTLRQRLLETHDQLLQRDEELVKLRQELTHAVETVQWMEASRSWQMIQKSWAWRQQAKRLFKPGQDKA